MSADDNAGNDRQKRFEQGLATMAKLDDVSGRQVVEAVADVSPELGYQMVAWGFGEVYSRPELAPRDRQLVTLGMLTALGGCEPQLAVHIDLALNAGLRPAEIIEALLHAAVYCGMPKAVNATFVAKKVFAVRGLQAA